LMIYDMIQINEMITSPLNRVPLPGSILFATNHFNYLIPKNCRVLIEHSQTNDQTYYPKILI
jgi:hypothetical protein